MDATGTLLGRGDLHGRVADRLAAGRLPHAGRDRRRHDLRGLVLAPNGHYPPGGYFPAGVDNAPLHALRNGIDGGNGVYRYGAGGAFPTNTFSASNYWVDVVFDTTIGPDTTPPTVKTVNPAGAIGVIRRDASR